MGPARIPGSTVIKVTHEEEALARIMNRVKVFGVSGDDLALGTVSLAFLQCPRALVIDTSSHVQNTVRRLRPTPLGLEAIWMRMVITDD